MGRAVLQACLPWLALLVMSLLCAYLLVRWSRSRMELGRLRQLHRDQGGTAQSLSFVLTLPFFVMIMLFIVQVSQLMIGTIIVHYAAYAAARSAVVWIPARLGQAETENCVSFYRPDPEAEEQVVPILDPTSEDYGPAEGGMTFIIEPGSSKFEKIRSAAVMACMPICPSRDLGLSLSGSGPVAADIIKAAYGAMVSDAQANAAIPRRLENKLAYAAQGTEVEIRFFHKNREPPLVPYAHLHNPVSLDDPVEFQFNELGWQDVITVTVRHKLALLPGPGRLLARDVPGPGGAPDEVSETIEQTGNVYVYPLEASVTMGNEGQKSVKPYEYGPY